MKMICFFLTAIIALTACYKTAKRVNEISKIEVATGGCFGPCQLTAVSIDSSLQYQYYGGDLLPGKKRKVIKGYFIGRVNESFWDT
jgi:hypothetical protein